MTHDSGSGDADVGFLVPVSDSPTLDSTVEYAARQAREVAAETDGRVGLYLVTPIGGQRAPESSVDRRAERLLSEASAVAEETLDVTDPSGTVVLETAILEQDQYPFDPFDYVDGIVGFGTERGVETLVLDPGHRMPAETPIMRSLEDELRPVEAFDIELAPVDRPARHQRLVTRGGIAQFLTLFGLSFAFYVVIGGFEEPVFDIATGAASALIVAGVLSRITFEETPRPTRMLRTVGRWAIYAPYLLWKVAVANLQIAYVVLHPSLPIDPTVERFEAGVWGGMATATLANSITLTPGTLTIDVRNREFVVHSLTTGAREDLLEGSLERAVRFVYYGRDALSYPTPRDRIADGEGNGDGADGGNDGDGVYGGGGGGGDPS